MSCRTAPAIDHTQPSSIAAKPASSPGVLRHLRRFSCSVTSLEAMAVFARRSEHGLSDSVWYALEALPCMVESNDASALCVRFGLSQEDLDALLSEGRYLTGDKVATFKAAIKGLLCQSLKNDTSCLSIVLVSSAHTSRMHARPDTGTICEKCIN